MRGDPSPMLASPNPVLERMAALGPVSAGLKHRIEALEQRSERVAARATLQVEHETAVRPRYILSGWAMRQRLLPDGRRQIFSLLLPGDSLGLRLRPSPLSTATTVAITAMVLLDASELMTPETLALHPELVELTEKAAAQDEALLLGHIVRLGRQTAFERLAHLLLELYGRLAAVDLARDHVLDAPFTQEVLADLLGLSIVHINRTLQQLRRERMIRTEGGQLVLLEPDMLASIADYTAPTAG